MSGINKVILVGNLGADPEVRATQDGREIASFSVATSETWKDKNTGERKERTEWHRIVVFNEGIVQVVKNYLKKGSKVYVEGMLATRKWTDQAGIERYTTEVVLKAFNGQLTMLDTKGSGGVPPASSPDDYGSGGSSGYSQAPINQPGPVDDLDDEIPF